MKRRWPCRLLGHTRRFRVGVFCTRCGAMIAKQRVDSVNMSTSYSGATKRKSP